MSRASLFIENLIRAVSHDPFMPKLLLAPSYRVGRQWLDQVASRVGSVVNVRATSLRRLMVDYARPALEPAGISPAAREELLKQVGLAVGGMAAKEKSGGYFASLPPSLVFTESLLRSLEELDNADIRTGKILAGKLVSDEKTDEMSSLIAAYRTAKRRGRLAGSADVGRAALEELKNTDPASLPFLLIPDSILDEATGFERMLLERWPRERSIVLPEDFADAPDGDVSGFAADCIANETREVVRRILTKKVALDRVETICFDSAAYVPALCSAGIEVFGGKIEELPFTFSGGIPALFSRPVRLVLAWLRWLREELPAGILADIVEAGLLGDEWQRRAPGVAASELAARLKVLPLAAGPEGYARMLGRGDIGEDMNVAERWLERAVRAVLPLSEDGRDLDLSPAVVLTSASALLEYGAEKDAKLDAYARLALREGIEAWVDHCEWPGFEALDWLEGFAEGLRVMGMGPQPGKMHVSDGVAGGHSGRDVTFVLGLDESRCPGNVRQDPILLDRERRDLSKKLRSSAWRRERKEKAVKRLFSRLRGTIYLGYSRRDAGSGRDVYPSSLYSKYCGSGVNRTAALRPGTEGACLNRRDDWLWSMLAWKRNTFTAADLAPWFPHLADGAAAVAARESDEFTPWDGNVPEAGQDFIEEEWVLSPSQLEGLALSPMDFFFRRALGVRKPDRWQPEPGRWLAGNERGQLLHDLFQDFMTELERLGEAVELKHETILLDMLDQAIERWRRQVPVLDEFAYARERAHLIEAAVIFLFHEAARSGLGRPVCFEAAVGGAEDDVPPWHRVEPVRLTFGESGTVRFQGRIDRVDRLRDHGGLVIWDYKTGRSSGFSRSDPFMGGRHLQPYLYTAMLEESLKEAGYPELVREFCYFFPMQRDEGGVIPYERDELRNGHEVVKALAGLLRSGCFPFARNREDVKNSDYLEVYGDVRSLAASAARKEDAEGRIAFWRALDGKPGKTEDGQGEA